MYKWAISFAILFATLSGVLFGGSYASALSDYDNTIRVVDNLTITDSSGNNSHDFSSDWLIEMTDVLDKRCNGLGGVDCTRLSLLNNMVSETGQWAVSRSGDPSGQYYITVYFSSNETGYGDFSLSGGVPTFFLRSVGATLVSYTFNINPSATYKSDNNLSLISMNDDGSTIAIPFQKSDYDPYFLFINFPITYPAGYEGEIIPDSYSPPIVYSDKPDIAVVNIVDWKITLQDRNFNTFDNVPFTCNDGLTPIIEYDLYNNDTDPITKIDQGVFSPTVQYEFQSEKYGIETEYKFIANYYCGTGDDQPSFSHQTTIYFTSSSAGLYVSDIITDCVLDEFPFVNIENCMNNMADAIQLLSFNQLRLPGGGGGGGGWGVSQTCYNMQVLDDWINSPNQQLCPMFPQYIRDIVTPFVTFALGLLMLNFLTKRGGGGF